MSHSSRSQNVVGALPQSWAQTRAIAAVRPDAATNVVRSVTARPLRPHYTTPGLDADSRISAHYSRGMGFKDRLYRVVQRNFEEHYCEVGRETLSTGLGSQLLRMLQLNDQTPKGGAASLMAESLGFVAGALVTCSIVPQLIRVFQLKSAREISMLFTSLLLLGITLWLVYGVYLKLNPVIIWNAVGAVLVALLLSAKLKYGR